MMNTLKSAIAALAFTLLPALALAQYGPPSSGSTSAIIFVPATLNLVAGLNGAGYAGNGGLANSSTTKLNYPVGIAYDSSGNLFIADESNYVVRRIDHTTGDISTFAGTNAFSNSPPAPTPTTQATTEPLGLLSGLVIDTSNNVYVADRTNNVVWEITPAGIISIFAGGGAGTCSGGVDAYGDGCPAIDGKLNNPWALGIDSSNNIYIADSYNDLVREVKKSTGNITTFAGDIADAGGYGDCNSYPNLYSTSTPPYTALQAHLCFPSALAFDSSGNAYIADYGNNIVRVVNHSTGDITTFAGNGTSGYAGDGGPALDAEFHGVEGLFVDPANRVYISDLFNGEIRMVDSTLNIYDVMGSTHGGLNNSSIGEPDTETLLVGAVYTGAVNGAYGIAMDLYGDLVVSDSSGEAVTSAGSTGQYYFGLQQVYQTVTTATLNALSSSYPPNITISNPSGVTLTFTGTPAITGPFAITGGTCTFPGSVAPGDSCTVIVSFTPIADQLYTGSIVLDSNANSSPSSINLSGTGTGTPTISGTLTSSLPSFTSPTGVTSASQTATLTNTGQGPLVINTAATSFVGTSSANFALAIPTGADCPASLNSGATCHFYVTFTPLAATTYTAQLQVVITNYGDLHTSLSGTGTAAATAPAVSISPSSYVFPATTVQSGYQSGNGNPAITLTNIGNAPLTFTGSTPFTVINGGTSSPFSVYPNGSCTGTYVDFSTSMPATDNCTITVQFWPQHAGVYAATLSVADNAANSPQTIPLSGVGKAGQLQFAPAQINALTAVSSPSGCHDSVALGGPAASATICMPSSAATDQNGNTYIADWQMSVIRKVDSSGNISNYAGYASSTGVGPGCAQQTDSLGDGCPALDATLSNPGSLVVDGAGNLYISDMGNNRVREVNAQTGIITTFVGGGSSTTFTAGQGASVSLPVTYGIAIDPSGNLYVATYGQNLVIKVDPTGNATIFAGVAGQYGYNGDNRLATSAKLNSPVSVATDLSGNVYIADTLNYRIRKVDTSGNITTVAGNGTGGDTGNGSAATNAEIWPISLAVDPAGEIYIGAVGVGGATDVVRKVDLSSNITTIAGGGSGGTLPAQAIGVGIPALAYIGLDLAGDVLIPSGSGLATAGPQGDLIFGSTNVGSTSTAQLVTITNTGNATVYFYNPNSSSAAPGEPGRAAATAGASSGGAVAAGTSIGGGVGTVTGDFAIATGGTCNLTTSGSIAVGASCTINVNFTPTQTGARPGNITLYADGPYTIPAVINLSGTGTGAALIAQTINFTQPTTPVTYASGLTIPLVATGGGSGNPVVFTIDTSSTGTGSITGATLNVTSVGTFVIDANQAGNSTYSAATQVQKSVAVTQAAQTINFTQPTTPVTYASGLTIPLVATGGNSGNSVVFTIDTSSTGTGSITGATLNVTSVGTFVIDANQAGNTNYAAATQVQKSVVVSAAPVPSFTVTSPTAPQTVQPGSAATYTINANPVNGSYTGTVTLSASGLPTGATASFVPPSVTPGSAGATSTLTIQTSAQTASAKSSVWPLAAPALSLIGLFFVPGKRRRRWLTMAVLLFASLGALTALSACGGGFQLHGSSSSSGSASTLYTITVNGANSSGAVVSSTTVQLTVQ